MATIAEVEHQGLFCTECEEYAKDCKLVCNNITDNQVKREVEAEE